MRLFLDIRCHHVRPWKRKLYKAEQIIRGKWQCMSFLTPFYTEYIHNYSETMHAHVNMDTRALSRGHRSTIAVCWLFVIRVEGIRHHLPASLSGSFPLRLFIRSQSLLFSWKNHSDCHSFIWMITRHILHRKPLTGSSYELWNHLDLHLHLHPLTH